MSCNKLCGLALVLSVVSFTLQANIFESLPELSAKRAAYSSNSVDDFSLRYRGVKYNSQFLFTQANDDSAHSSTMVIQRRLQLDLFDDLSLSAVAKNVYTRADGKTVWMGQIAGQPNSTVNIIADQQQFTANIRLQGKIFQIRTQANGQLLVNHFAAPELISTDVLRSFNVGVQAKSQKQSQSSAAITPIQNSALPLYSNEIDGFADKADVSVLVYYTNQALEAMPDLLNIIDLEFIETNQAFENSNIDASVSIAAKIAVDESPISGGLAFDELSQKKGPFSNIDVIRQKYHADLVHFYPLRLKDACGLAYYAAFPDGWSEREYGYGATAVFCTGNLTTAHELGHNFGAAHDRYVEDGGTNAANYGYVDLENQFKTIMAYTNECDDNDVYCENIAHFSNPNQLYGTAPTGLSEPVSKATDNSAQINASALTLANFYGVSTPTINAISQGKNAQGVALSWTAVANSTAYKVTRRNADIEGINGPLCSFPLYGEEFTVESNEFLDSSVTSGVIYCYSVTALNSELLSNATSPESFVRTGYFYTDNSHVLPFIDDITLDNEPSVYQSQLTLSEDFEYQLILVEHSSELPPNLQLLATEGTYTIKISDIEQINQTFTAALIATHKTSNKVLAQQFNVFSNGFENKRPILSTENTLILDQQTTAQFNITLTDDQAIAADGVYAYSRNSDIISSAWVTQDDNQQFIVHVKSEGLKTGQAKVVVGYSDGEYLIEFVVTVTVNRTIFNPTQTFDATWYVLPDHSITRLLPFYDIDEGEVLSISMLAPPQQGELDFVLSDKVTYTAASNFTEDSFIFDVTGEDGQTSAQVTVRILPSPATYLTATQKIVVSNEYAAFLSHHGHLYTWGRNDSGELGLNGSISDAVYIPSKVAGEEWVDVAQRHSEAFAIKKDGTLWHVGYDFFTRQVDKVFTQVGTDTDWQTVIGVNSNALVLLTKTDGSIWGRGRNDTNTFTNRPELNGDVTNITQILPLYDVKKIQFTGETGFALTNDNQLYSWGSNRLSDLGRSEFLGYLAPLKNFSTVISDFTSRSFRSILLTDGNLIAWGKGISQLFLDQGDNFPEPTKLGNDRWRQVALGDGFMAGIRKDGSLWTWGGYLTVNDEPAINPQLARGDYPDNSIAQVGTKNNWLNVWAAESNVFVLNNLGEIWVAGGSQMIVSATNGLGQSNTMVSNLTLVESIPINITGTGDFDGDQLADYVDPDDDDDGVLDQNDAFRTNADEYLDTDNDGIGNNQDTDDDGDGINDTDDAFPLDSSESVDTDADGIGNNADTDDDNDGVNDTNDAFPLDASRSKAPNPPTNTTNSGSGSGGGGGLAYLLLLILFCSIRVFITKDKNARA